MYSPSNSVSSMPIIFRSVLFPEPEGPVNTKKSPGIRLMFRSLRINRSEKNLDLIDILITYYNLKCCI